MPQEEEPKFVERHGYMLFVDPILALLRLGLTVITLWTVVEILKTEQGRQMVRHLPQILSSMIKAVV